MVVTRPVDRGGDSGFGEFPPCGGKSKKIGLENVLKW